MNSTRYDFTPPPIVGVLGGPSLAKAHARRFERVLRARGFDAACLPFQVQTRHLKNLVACMRLMDIVGLVVLPELSAHVARHMDHLDADARSTGLVDAIVRRGRRLIGICTLPHAIRQCLTISSDTTVVVAGTGPHAAAIRRALGKCPSRAVRTLPRRMPSPAGDHCLIIDATGSARASTYVIPISRIDDHAQAIAADVIISSFK